MKSLAFGRNKIVIQLWLYGQSGRKGILKTGEVGKKRKIARQNTEDKAPTSFWLESTLLWKE